jgi:predicted GH43/DUF377 family glycosyl hydrolase
MQNVPATTQPVSPRAMQEVFDQTKTPYKHGIIIRGPDKALVDCVSMKDRVGYETHLATSDDLIKWEPLGKVLSHRKEENAWDRWQADGGISLVDHAWGGTHAPATFDGKYWMSYIGGAGQGYEPDPLAIGMAWTKTPDQPIEWNRVERNPVLGPSDPDVRPFEAKTLYKSSIIWDKTETLKHPFVMYYNGKQAGDRGWERIGMAVSNDMVHWSRYGADAVVDNQTGISGDPQIVRIGDLWVMFYFGHRWKPKAFDTFACSHDMVNWTRWEGAHLIEPSEPWDKTFAHKPWVLKYDGVVYHYYCAVGDEGRVIALATSKKV